MDGKTVSHETCRQKYGTSMCERGGCKQGATRTLALCHVEWKWNGKSAAMLDRAHAWQRSELRMNTAMAGVVFRAH